MTSKEKRIRDRLGQIQASAQSMILNAKQADPVKAANLAEEAAGLGLELLEEVK